MSKDNQYNQIYQLWKSERQSSNLLEVKSIVYSTIRQKIITLEKELDKIDKKDTISKQIVEARIERLKKILRDLAKIRMHKIIHGILNENLNVNDLAAEELDLVKNLNKNFDEHNDRSILGREVKSSYMSSSTKDDGSNETEQMTVRILEDLPEIVDATSKGKEKRVFGPFKKEDIVRLPLIYAKTLIMKNAADRVDLPDL
ncbi:MAG: hypothetical protein ACFFDW_01125 [Candidatus Thorarchaeota archaeon]